MRVAAVVPQPSANLSPQQTPLAVHRPTYISRAQPPLWAMADAGYRLTVHSEQIRVEILDLLLLEIYDNLRGHSQVIATPMISSSSTGGGKCGASEGLASGIPSGREVLVGGAKPGSLPKNGGSARPVSVAVPVPATVVVGAYHVVLRSMMQLVTHLEVGKRDLSSTVLVSSGVRAVRVAVACRER